MIVPSIQRQSIWLYNTAYSQHLVIRSESWIRRFHLIIHYDWYWIGTPVTDCMVHSLHSFPVKIEKWARWMIKSPQQTAIIIKSVSSAFQNTRYSQVWLRYTWHLDDTWWNIIIHLWANLPGHLSPIFFLNFPALCINLAFLRIKTSYRLETTARLFVCFLEIMRGQISMHINHYQSFSFLLILIIQMSKILNSYHSVLESSESGAKWLS